MRERREGERLPPRLERGRGADEHPEQTSRRDRASGGTLQVARRLTCARAAASPARFREPDDDGSFLHCLLGGAEREWNLKSRTAQRVAAGGGALCASSSSNCSRAESPSSHQWRLGADASAGLAPPPNVAGNTRFYAAEQNKNIFLLLTTGNVIRHLAIQIGTAAVVAAVAALAKVDYASLGVYAPAAQMGAALVASIVNEALGAAPSKS